MTAHFKYKQMSDDINGYLRSKGFESLEKDDLSSSLKAFQKYKKLGKADGSFNLQTLAALGEEIDDCSLRLILLRTPGLKSLFLSQRTSYLKPSLQPDVVMVPINLIYNPQRLPSDYRGNALQYVQTVLRPMLDYWEKTFRKLYLGYTIDFTEGDAAFNGAGHYLTKGKKEGYANIFYFDNNLELKSDCVTYPETREIFLADKSNDRLPARSMCHELCHFFGINYLTGINWVDSRTSGISNIISDSFINWALRQLKSDSVQYGKDWVDDYREIRDYSQNRKMPRSDADYPIRKPTMYDYIRTGAKIFVEERR